MTFIAWVIAIPLIFIWITLSGLVTEIKKLVIAFQIIAMWYEADGNPRVVVGPKEGEEI